MADPYLGEIRLFSFNFAPSGWATCDGQLLQISQNNALYALLGIMYGGNGSTNFNLPDLRGRTPLHFTSGFAQGQNGGYEGIALTQSQIPGHVHGLVATSATTNTTNAPGGNAFGSSLANYPVYSDVANLTLMNTGTIGLEGGGVAHDNMQPFLVVNFCIALSGIFPPRS